MTPRRRLGATVVGDGCAFEVWAPHARTVEVELADRRVALTPREAESTFLAGKLELEHAERSPHREILALYRTLIALRREHAPLVVGTRPRCELLDDGGLLVVDLGGVGELVLVANVEPTARAAEVALPPGRWRVLLDSEDARFGGGGEALASEPTPGVAVALPGFWFALFQRKR